MKFPSELDSLILGRKVPEEAVQAASKKSKRYTAEFQRDVVALVYSSHSLDRANLGPGRITGAARTHTLHG